MTVVAPASASDLLNALEETRATLVTLEPPDRRDLIGVLEHRARVIEVTDRLIRDPAICAAWYVLQREDPELVPVARIEAICEKIARLAEVVGHHGEVFDLMRSLGEVDVQPGRVAYRRQVERERDDLLRRLRPPLD